MTMCGVGLHKQAGSWAKNATTWSWHGSRRCAETEGCAAHWGDRMGPISHKEDSYG